MKIYQRKDSLILKASEINKLKLLLLSFMSHPILNILPN